jgi:hypothetical protein
MSDSVAEKAESVTVKTGSMKRRFVNPFTQKVEQMTREAYLELITEYEKQAKEAEDAYQQNGMRTPPDSDDDAGGGSLKRRKSKKTKRRKTKKRKTKRRKGV